MWILGVQAKSWSGFLEIPHLIASETAQFQQLPLISVTASTTGQRCEDKSRGKEEGDTLTTMAGKACPVPYTSPEAPGKDAAWSQSTWAATPQRHPPDPA